MFVYMVMHEVECFCSYVFRVLPPYKLSALIQDILQTFGLGFFRNFPFFHG